MRHGVAPLLSELRELIILFVFKSVLEFCYLINQAKPIIFSKIQLHITLYVFAQNVDNIIAKLYCCLFVNFISSISDIFIDTIELMPIINKTFLIFFFINISLPPFQVIFVLRMLCVAEKQAQARTNPIIRDSNSNNRFSKDI